MELSKYTVEQLQKEIENRKIKKVCLSDLSVLAYANNFTLWHYKTNHDFVNDNGYFNDAALTMRVNDLIIANTGCGTRFYIVSDIVGSHVTIKDMGSMP